MTTYSVIALERGRPAERGDVEAADEAAAVALYAEAQKKTMEAVPGGEFTVVREWKRTPTRIGIRYASKTLRHDAWVWILGPSELDERGKAKRLAETPEEVARRAERQRERDRRRADGLALYDAYSSRHAVKAAGGIWDGALLAWLLPDEDAARKLGARRASGDRGPHWTMKPEGEEQ